MSETAKAAAMTAMAKYSTAAYPCEWAMAPAARGPATVAMAMLELNIPVLVDLGLCSMRWKLPPMYRNAHVPPTSAMNGMACHHSPTNSSPTKTKVVMPTPTLNFVTCGIRMRLAMRVITAKAVAVFETYTTDMWCSCPPSCPVIMRGSTVHTAAAPTCRSRSARKRYLFREIIPLMAPGPPSRAPRGSGSPAGAARPAPNMHEATRNISLVSLVIPAAAMPASQPSAWNETTEATAFLPRPDSYA